LQDLKPSLVSHLEELVESDITISDGDTVGVGDVVELQEPPEQPDKEDGEVASEWEDGKVASEEVVQQLVLSLTM
jgi:hypothetical protein